MGFKFVPVFRIRVIYKSGYVHDFDCFSFKYNRSSIVTEYSWEPASHNKPVFFGADEVAAVWQLSYRRKLRWVKKPKT